MKKIVGIEIAEDSVRLVCFAGRELKKAVTVETPEGLVSGGRILSMDAMADFLRDSAKANGIPLTACALLLPSSEVFTRAVTVPAMTEQQLAYNLPYEFHDFLTEEKSKYFFDYSVRRVLKDEEGYPKEMELLACAILKSRVEEYRAMLHRAGFKLKVLTPAECAYAAVLAFAEERDDTLRESCIVALGHSSSHLYIYHGREFDSHREIDIGSAALDVLIAEDQSVDIHVARGYRQKNYNGVLEADYARDIYARLAVEVVKAVNFYNYNNRDRELTDVYFCGGDNIGALVHAMEENTKLRVCPAAELLAQEMRPADEPWMYLGAIGAVGEGMRGEAK